MTVINFLFWFISENSLSVHGRQVGVNTELCDFIDAMALDKERRWRLEDTDVVLETQRFYIWLILIVYDCDIRY